MWEHPYRWPNLSHRLPDRTPPSAIKMQSTRCTDTVWTRRLASLPSTWWRAVWTRIQALRDTKLWNIWPKTVKHWTRLVSAPLPETTQETTEAFKLQSSLAWCPACSRTDQPLRNRVQVLDSKTTSTVHSLSISATQESPIWTSRSKTCFELRVAIHRAVEKSLEA